MTTTRFWDWLPTRPVRSSQGTRGTNAHAMSSQEDGCGRNTSRSIYRVALWPESLDARPGEEVVNSIERQSSISVRQHLHQRLCTRFVIESSAASFDDEVECPTNLNSTLVADIMRSLIVYICYASVDLTPGEHARLPNVTSRATEQTGVLPVGL